MIKLLILDMDGVMTDGTKTYNLEGEVISKAFYDHDFSAIKKFKADSLQVCFLSGDRRVNEKVAQNRKIDFYHSEAGSDKVDLLTMLCDKYEVLPAEIAYVGDDVLDSRIMESVGFPYCPANAANEIAEICLKRGKILSRNAGSGVIDELYFFLKNHDNETRANW
tara:strand:+ start:126 stop:620 length:495 start_codon:yes stop_codon:yes gene_type:complete